MKLYTVTDTKSDSNGKFIYGTLIALEVVIPQSIKMNNIKLNFGKAMTNSLGRALGLFADYGTILTHKELFSDDGILRDLGDEPITDEDSKVIRYNEDSTVNGDKCLVRLTIVRGYIYAFGGEIELKCGYNNQLTGSPYQLEKPRMDFAGVEYPPNYSGPKV